jgi:hypothetical protein
MTDSERQQILKMIADGTISAEQGLVLMQALDGQPESETTQPEELPELDDLEPDDLEPVALAEPEDEHQKILQMIEDGKISPEQGLTLMQALGGESQPDSETSQTPEPEVVSPSSGFENHPIGDPGFERKLSRFRKLWVIPLGLGVAITVTGAYWMFAAMRSGGFGFWFYASWLPFLLGVLLTALGFSSRTSRWVYLNVKQKPGESPQRIMLAFPLAWVSGLVSLAKSNIPEREGFAVNEVMNALSSGTGTSDPLLVDVHDKDGQHVQVYIG